MLLCVIRYMQVVSCCYVSCDTCRLCHVAVLCHAIHAGNFSSELTCLTNLETFVNPSTLPLLPQLLSRFHFHFLRLLFSLFLNYDNLCRIVNPMIMLSNISFFSAWTLPKNSIFAWDIRYCSIVNFFQTTQNVNVLSELQILCLSKLSCLIPADLFSCQQ